LDVILALCKKQRQIKGTFGLKLHVTTRKRINESMTPPIQLLHPITAKFRGSIHAPHVLSILAISDSKQAEVMTLKASKHLSTNTNWEGPSNAGWQGWTVGCERLVTACTPNF
jgi:hypothetical protein